jgi:hypothetical protein
MTPPGAGPVTALVFTLSMRPAERLSIEKIQGGLQSRVRWFTSSLRLFRESRWRRCCASTGVAGETISVVWSGSSCLCVIHLVSVFYFWLGGSVIRQLRQNEMRHCNPKRYPKKTASGAVSGQFTTFQSRT